MSTIHHLARSLSIGRMSQASALATSSHSLGTIYDQLIARDSSSIHAGDRYTTNHIAINSPSNHISVAGPAVLVDSNILESPGVLSLIEQLETTTLRLEDLQNAVQRLERGRQQDRSVSPKSVTKIHKHRRDNNRSKRALRPGATLHRSITFTLPPPGDHHTILTMKVRFTISYEEHFNFGFTSHWYEYDIVVANPAHRKLLASHSGIGIATLDTDNEYFPSFEVSIALEDGWVWQDEDLDWSGESSSSDSETEVRAEVFRCRRGRQVVERDFRFKRRPLLLR